MLLICFKANLFTSFNWHGNNKFDKHECEYQKKDTFIGIILVIITCSCCKNIYTHVGC